MQLQGTVFLIVCLTQYIQTVRSSQPHAIHASSGTAVSQSPHNKPSSGKETNSETENPNKAIQTSVLQYITSKSIDRIFWLRSNDTIISCLQRVPLLELITFERSAMPIMR